MRTYGIVDCLDCGKKITRKSPSQKRCKKCALKAHQQTGYGFEYKKCQVCDIEFKPTSFAKVSNSFIVFPSKPLKIIFPFLTTS